MGRAPGRVMVMPISAYDSDAIRLLSTALEIVLTEVERCNAAALEAERPALTSKITRDLMEAYDDGAHDLEALKRAGLAAIEPPAH